MLAFFCPALAWRHRREYTARSIRRAGSAVRLAALIRRLLRLAAMTIPVLGLAACGMFSDPDPRYLPAELTEYPPSLSVGVRWSVQLGNGGDYGFSPQVVNDTAYAAVPSGTVAAINLANGAIRWRTDAGPLTAGAGSDGQTTAVVTRAGMVLALGASGQELWRTQAASAVIMPPAVGHGVVVVRTTDYRIQAFDAATGKLRWNVQRPGPALALRTSMRMTFASDLLVAGMPNGRLMLLDPATGAVRWEGTVSAARGASDLERISDIVGQPVTVGAALCGVSYQGRITCFDVSQGGRAVWSAETGSATGMTNDGKNLYLADHRDVVRAIDMQDGHEVWKQATLLNRLLSTPAIAGSAVAFGDYQGYVHFLNRDTGRLAARLQVGSGPIRSSLVSTPQGVLVQTGNGSLVLVGVSG